jgi:hypothetical protein
MVANIDGHWRFTWSLTLEPVGLVEVRVNWADTHINLKRKIKSYLEGMTKI